MVFKLGILMLPFSRNNSGLTMNIEIYQSLRQEILHSTELSWKARNWSILITGATIALIINVLFGYKILNGILTDDPILLCIFILYGFSVINFFLWSISIQLSKGIIEMGAYLYHLEDKVNIPHGWEHYMFHSRKKKKYDFAWLFEDLNFYISIGVLVLDIVFCLYASNYYNSIIILTCILIYGSSSRLKLNEYREIKLKITHQCFNSIKSTDNVEKKYPDSNL